MTDSIKPTKVVILDKEFMVACPVEEQAALLESADYLNGKMKEVQRNGKVIGIDRITIMAALNIAHEFLQQRDNGNNFDQSIGSRLHLMQDKIDTTMNKVQQVEF
jgi:cell division protein ZapA